MEIKPTPKMSAVGIVGAITVVLFWALKQYANIEFPGEVAAAITLIMSWVAGWFAPKSIQ